MNDFKNKPCLICGLHNPVYVWTDYSGEATCSRCETPYQLKWGDLAPGETYPRINLKEEYIPAIRQYWAQEQRPVGLGTFLSRDPEREERHRALDVWLEANKELIDEPKEAL